MWRCLVVVSLLLSALVAPSARAQEPTPPASRTIGRVFATAGIAGRLADAVCDGGATIVAHEASAFTGVLVSHGTRHAPAMVVDAGALLAPHGVIRFANRDRPDLVADLVQALGYDALALGESDLAAPRERTVHVAEVLADRGIPYVASNLRCEGEGAPLCDAVIDVSDAAPVVETGSLHAAFLAMLAPEVLDRVAPDRAAGLEIAPIDAALPAAVRAARAAGADFVVAVLDLGVDEVLALAAALPVDGRPDLVLLPYAGHELGFAEPTSRALAIVAPPPGSGVEVRVRRDDEDEDAARELHAVPFVLEGVAPDAAVVTFANAIGPTYCAVWGTPLAGGHLARDLDAPGVASLGAEIVREHADADVAFLNVAAIDERFRGATDERLTNGDLYVAIEFDEPIVYADVPASWLFEAQQRLSAHHVVAAGLTTTAGEGEALSAGAMRVRGRASVPRVDYRVATIRFLAEGGDDALPALPEGVRWTTLEHPATDGTTRYVSLREVIIDALEQADERDPRDARISPDEAPEWILRGQIDGNFSGSTVANDAGYEAAPLAVGSAIAMGLELDVHLDARAPNWSWESQLFGRYRTQWVPGTEMGPPTGFVEAADQLQLRTLASYRGFRGLDGPVYIPDLYVEAFVESELTQPEERNYHWLLVRPTFGLRFPLANELDVKLQLGFQAQVLDPMGEAEIGAGASVLLRPWVAVAGDERSLTIDGLVDFFAFDLFDRNQWQLRSQLNVVLDLAGPLALTFGTTLYLQAEGDQAVALALAATIGVRLSGVTRVVGP